MAVEVTWDNPSQTIISQSYLDRWTWEGFYWTNYEATRYLMMGTPNTVHVIADMQDAYSTSMEGALTHLHNSFSSFPKNWGVMVVINQQIFVQMLIDLYCRNHPEFANRIFIASNRAEAYALIQQFEQEHAA